MLAEWTVASDPGVTGYTASAVPGPATCTTDSRTITSCVLGAVAGQSYTVTVVAHSVAGDSVVSTASAPATAIAPAAPPAPPRTPLKLTTDRGPITSIAPGQPLTFIGSGFAPFSTVVVSIYSAPATLATVTTDASGGFSAPVTIPAGLAEGSHTMLAQGTAPDGTARAMAVAVTTTARRRCR
ncbi:hypothetical protein AB0J72_44195 [Dactylosporangium sp. NPDC049742]|uniref:hypothetical protein n=1 Tax=Dactylosporangium sp. NPDC049742 TaxID=3154737 RepID=UPI0034180C8B